MSEPAVDLTAFWTYIVSETKSKIAMPALFRALEAAKPLALEGDLLVLGMNPAAMHQAGLLSDHRTKNVIEQIMESATRRRIRFTVIPGDTAEDWDHYQATQSEGQRLQQQTLKQHQQTVEAGTTWEAVGEQLTRRFSSLNNRALAGVQGRYLAEAVEVLAEAYGRLMSESPSEADERAYSRVLDRIGERGQVTGSMLAYLVHTHRASSGG